MPKFDEPKKPPEQVPPVARPAAGRVTPSPRVAEATLLAESVQREIGSSLSVGSIIGRYKVIDKIGEGGMGTVFKVVDPKLPEWEKALKLMQGFDPQRRQRFKEEALTLVGLTRDTTHPHIIRIFEYDETSKDEPYIVMEYLRGKTLGKYIDSTKTPSWDVVKTIAAQICDALQAVHQKGIIHRDLKPDNIFLINLEGNPYFVKILDFGLAKDTDKGVNITTVGAGVGTPSYMSPEQLVNDQVDFRTDIYALGAILYRIFCKKAPFALGDSKSAGQRFYNDVLNTKPVPPHEINPDVPMNVSALIMRALEKDPAKRFQSMAEMKAAILEEPTLSARQIKQQEEERQRQQEEAEKEMRRRTKRNIIGVAVASVCIAAATVLGVIHRDRLSTFIESLRTNNQAKTTEVEKVLAPPEIRLGPNMFTLTFQTSSDAYLFKGSTPICQVGPGKPCPFPITFKEGYVITSEVKGYELMPFDQNLERVILADSTNLPSSLHADTTVTIEFKPKPVSIPEPVIPSTQPIVQPDAQAVPVEAETSHLSRRKHIDEPVEEPIIQVHPDAEPVKSKKSPDAGTTEEPAEDDPAIKTDKLEKLGQDQNDN